jgi:7-carboxy-7-deazaguanine synthase
MSYSVKEMFLTLQGEGVHTGRRAVFVRFSGCNLWSGREVDRASAICRFCDTDFVGIKGIGGGRFETAFALAAAAEAIWGSERRERYVVLTGGEPLLQVNLALIDALHSASFTIGVESNGTVAAIPGIDWLCISPKPGSDVVQRAGNELKLVWPQLGTDIDDLETWDFQHYLIQPMDCIDNDAARQAAIDLVMARPKWRLSTQTHKSLGLR